MPRVTLAASVSRVPPCLKPVACLYLAHSPPLPTNIYIFLILFRSVYICTFFNNILPCISILSYKKKSISIYVSRVLRTTSVSVSTLHHAIAVNTCLAVPCPYPAYADCPRLALRHTHFLLAPCVPLPTPCPTPYSLPARRKCARCVASPQACALPIPCPFATPANKYVYLSLAYFC